MNRAAVPGVLETPPAVTVTFTVPLPAGLVALHSVVLLQSTPVAEFAPNCTVVAPGTKRLPRRVATVPPLWDPLVNPILVTVGGET